MSNEEAIKKALEEVGPLKVEFTTDCDDFNSIIAPINADYDGTYFTLIGAGDKQNDLGNLFMLAVNSMPELLTTLEALQRENENLRRALKPFSRIADMEERAGPADSVMVNVARCRDARTALTAQVQDVAEIRSQAIEDVLSALTAHELYQYRPRAFQGFMDYARSTLMNDEDAKIWRPAAAPAKQEG